MYYDERDHEHTSTFITKYDFVFISKCNKNTMKAYIGLKSQERTSDSFKNSRSWSAVKRSIKDNFFPEHTIEYDSLIDIQCIPPTNLCWKGPTRGVIDNRTGSGYLYVFTNSKFSVSQIYWGWNEEPIINWVPAQRGTKRPVSTRNRKTIQSIIYILFCL